MKNIIMNPRWQPGPFCCPKYFTFAGPFTYDDFSINGYRTCSLTMPASDDILAQHVYDPSIIVNGSNFYWGIRIRAVDAHKVDLAIDYYDSAGDLMQSDRFPITHLMDHHFQLIINRFKVPEIAQTLRVFLDFSGKITACTFCQPTAYFK